MSNLTIDFSNGTAKLSGYIDETADFSVLSGATGKLEVDFKGVTRVNSCGIREWVNALAKIPATEIEYLECPAVVVKQLNAVPDFQGRAKVASFYAPYFCEPCEMEKAVLVKGTAFQGAGPEFKCPKCGKPMNLDAIPAQYFAFLSRK